MTTPTRRPTPSEVKAIRLYASGRGFDLMDRCNKRSFAIRNRFTDEFPVGKDATLEADLQYLNRQPEVESVSPRLVRIEDLQVRLREGD